MQNNPIREDNIVDSTEISRVDFLTIQDECSIIDSAKENVNDGNSADIENLNNLGKGLTKYQSCKFLIIVVEDPIDVVSPTYLGGNLAKNEDPISKDNTSPHESSANDTHDDSELEEITVDSLFNSLADYEDIRVGWRMVVTRGVISIIKPNPKYALSTKARKIIVPCSFRQALLDAIWKMVMEQEFNALQENQTWDHVLLLITS